MATTQTDNATELEIIEQLDFKPSIPCSQSMKGVPCPRGAAYIINDVGHHDEPAEQKPVCQGCWDYCGITGLICGRCGGRGSRDDYWMIVATL